MEKFIVSARKYRPQTFDTVVGQSHITTTLRNAIKHEQLAHAFLFCGPRGVGKTTCARILAKTINCENPTPEGEACNTCHSCTSFNEGTSLNYFELDAASNNSVDNIRDLVDQVRFVPQTGKYKVYVIDEVHMLSSAAFNAFLKTLEEPPSYAIFILATTEKHKILPTILSRCQIFDFKRITLQDTVDHLEEIAEKEHIKTDKASLQVIAQKSEGCMRDALSILDKIVSFTNGEVSYATTLEHLNILDADCYFTFLQQMQEQDLAGALLLYDDINSKGFEGDLVLNGFAEFLRNLLVCKDEKAAGLLEVVEGFRDKYISAAKEIAAPVLISALNILNEAEIQYKAARNKRLHVELALIKLCYLQQALRLSSESAGIDKKKLAETSRPLAFRQIQPLEWKKPVGLETKKPQTTGGAKLQIEVEATPVQTAVQPGKRSPGKMKTLEDIRRELAAKKTTVVADKGPVLEQISLVSAWKNFIEKLKEEKSPAAQSFDLAELRIKGDHDFEAAVPSIISKQFIEQNRNAVFAFLKKELNISKLQFNVIFEENAAGRPQTDIPLSSKEQYQKMIKEYPMVQQLKERLRLDLDY